jgi:thiamine-monophosphate kinase
MVERRGARELPSEGALIETFRRAFATKDPRVRVGIGDDAAVLELPSPLVWTIDDSVEGVHFDRRWLTIGQAAGRAFEAALSDVAAMGAKPLCALSSLQVPASATASELRAIRAAQRSAARRAKSPIVGGNVTRGPGYRFTTTLLGHVKYPVLRSAARPGHELWLIGPVGMAGCGRCWLERGATPPKGALGRAITRCVRAWQEPRARVEDGLSLDGRKHSAIDVSDGLATECRTLSRQSGVRVELDGGALRAAFDPELLLAAEKLSEDPLGFALFGGEDYALLASGPARTRPKGARVIGAIRRGSGAVLVGEGRARLLRGGHDHLAS